MVRKFYEKKKPNKKSNKKDAQISQKLSSIPLGGGSRLSTNSVVNPYSRLMGGQPYPNLHSSLRPDLMRNPQPYGTMRSPQPTMGPVPPYGQPLNNSVFGSSQFPLPPMPVPNLVNVQNDLAFNNYIRHLSQQLNASIPGLPGVAPLQLPVPPGPFNFPALHQQLGAPNNIFQRPTFPTQEEYNLCFLPYTPERYEALLRAHKNLKLPGRLVLQKI
ncbi:Protein HAIKU1 [Caenorhabditis elegans]|uniref:Protein HAIKU1 n=1 Tax=Caenorhabditis elegans TaxID=6239 RepID=Q18661_CAEEL|nr:Protein HAIKU1 [Caenorhabditis elegans]CCD65699.1 Protein HAIKU1 [Caenorhabditis elegans]|eukprot:NP_508228.1 Uncharacterized protein CELE_C46H3.1 [Caenorhabditis elegans]